MRETFRAAVGCLAIPLTILAATGLALVAQQPH